MNIMLGKRQMKYGKYGTLQCQLPIFALSDENSCVVWYQSAVEAVLRVWYHGIFKFDPILNCFYIMQSALHPHPMLNTQYFLPPADKCVISYSSFWSKRGKKRLKFLIKLNYQQSLRWLWFIFFHLTVLSFSTGVQIMLRVSFARRS